jgi:glycosyltransferase involved in cell wall biosynthesis
MEKKLISVIMHYSENLSYSDADFFKSIDSLIKQNYTNWELILIDDRGDNALYPNIPADQRIIHLPGKYLNRANQINTGIRKASGDFIVLVNNLTNLINFKQSALEVLLMVAERNYNVGMVYSDYRLIDATGTSKDIHLLDHHQGRLRDNMDYGAVLFFPKQVIQQVGGLDEKYQAADLYDLRLKVASQFKLIHLNAAINGYTYTVKAPAKVHNVFDYLLAGKNVQIEMEQACTEHLKRIKAYLSPGTHYHEITYTPEEENQFKKCIASVVIPVFNREEFIKTAIDSVQAQTVQNIEVIVVCNGGECDSTIRGVELYLPGGTRYNPDKPPVRLIVADVNNIGYCLNKGIQEAKGKFYIQLDSDDRLKPDAVEKILQVFNSDNRIGMVIGSYEVWKKDDATGEITRMSEIPVVTHDEWTEENGRNNLLRINGAGAPRAAHIKVIQQLGGFGVNDTNYCRNYGEDYGLVLRMSEQYRIDRVWEAIYDVVRHSGGTDHSIDQVTIDRNDNAKDQMRLEAIERRKGL